MFKLNRTEIRKALAAYKEAMRQNELIKEDQEIQSLYDKEYELLAQEKYETAVTFTEKYDQLIQERYPMGTWSVIYDKAKQLSTLMTKGVPTYEDVDIMTDIVFNPPVLDEIVKIAEQV